MSRPQKRSRRTSAALFASVLAASAMTTSVVPPPRRRSRHRDRRFPRPPPPRRWALTTPNCSAEARAKKAPTVTLIVATEKGKAGEVADDLDQARRHRRPAAWTRSATCWPRSRPTGSSRPPAPRRLRRRPRRGHPAAGPGGRSNDRHRHAPARPAGHRPGAGRPPRPQPVHADQRDRRGRVQADAPRRGTAAASRSASWTPASTSTTRRCRRPPPASARSSTGSPRPTRSRGDGTWRPMSPRSPARRSPAGAHLDRAGRHVPVQPVQPSPSPPAATPRGDVNRDGDTTDTLRRPLRPGDQQHLGGRQPEPRLHRRRR